MKDSISLPYILYLAYFVDGYRELRVGYLLLSVEVKDLVI